MPGWKGNEPEFKVSIGCLQGMGLHASRKKSLINVGVELEFLIPSSSVMVVSLVECG